MKYFQHISRHQDCTFWEAGKQGLWHSESTDNQYTYIYKNHSNFTGKEKDSESGYYYFGARYLDQDMTTLFLSVDPMADKYPGISPYAYCAWNPIKLVDPNGMDWELIVDHEKKTVTIRAQYAVRDGDVKTYRSAEIAIKKWNDLSGQYALKTGDEKYTILFDLSVINLSEYDDKNVCHNTYEIVPEFKDMNILGETHQRHIKILESEKYNYITSSHEIGHSLGLLHNETMTGLMEEDSGKSSGDYSITRYNILRIIELSYHPERRDGRYASGFGTIRNIGSSSIDLSDVNKIRLIKNK